MTCNVWNDFTVKWYLLFWSDSKQIIQVDRSSSKYIISTLNKISAWNKGHRDNMARIISKYMVLVYRCNYYKSIGPGLQSTLNNPMAKPNLCKHTRLFIVSSCIYTRIASVYTDSQIQMEASKCSRPEHRLVLVWISALYIVKPSGLLCCRCVIWIRDIYSLNLFRPCLVFGYKRLVIINGNCIYDKKDAL